MLRSNLDVYRGAEVSCRLSVCRGKLFESWMSEVGESLGNDDLNWSHFGPVTRAFCSRVSSLCNYVSSSELVLM